MTAMVPLATVTLSSAASAINLTSIPQTYKNLYCSMTWSHDTTSMSCRMRFNSNANAQYTWKGYRVNSTNVNSVTTFDDVFIFFAWGAYTGTLPRMSSQFFINNYTSTTIQKTGTAFSASAADQAANSNEARVSWTWTNNSAISSINIDANGNFNSGTTITIYGLS